MAGAVFLTVAAFAAAARFGAGLAGFRAALALAGGFAVFFTPADFFAVATLAAAFAGALDTLADFAAFDLFFAMGLVPPRGTDTKIRALSRKETRRSGR